MIAGNAGGGIDRMVRRWPWQVLCVVVVASVTVSAVNIMDARSERDAASRQAVHLQQQVESLSCAVEAGKEARR